MTVAMRVGSGKLRDGFSPDLLEEIRIMAEAAQAPLSETLPPGRCGPRSFAAMLAQVFAPASRH